VPIFKVHAVFKEQTINKLFIVYNLLGNPGDGTSIICCPNVTGGIFFPLFCSFSFGFFLPLPENQKCNTGKCRMNLASMWDILDLP
jgi:hypothetical protein